MVETVNVYCDESCHLENDGQRIMVLGAIWCSDPKKRETAQRIAEIKRKHGMPATFEFKWTKVSASKIEMYMDLVDYFFDDDDLRFRCLVVPDKTKLDHARHGQSHDEWYYKMYFNMLKVLLKPSDRYHIYLDIKDTRSREKVCKLHDVLSNNAYDFSRSMIRRVQQVRSHEIAHIQLADILIGAMVYAFRDERANAGKWDIVSRIRKRTAYTLKQSTLYKEEKFNIFVWRGGDD